MNAKQLKAAERMLKLLKKIEASLESQKCEGCVALEQTRDQALASNRNCQYAINEQLRVSRKLAMV